MVHEPPGSVAAHVDAGHHRGVVVVAAPRLPSVAEHRALGRELEQTDVGDRERVPAATGIHRLYTRVAVEGCAGNDDGRLVGEVAAVGVTTTGAELLLDAEKFVMYGAHIHCIPMALERDTVLWTALSILDAEGTEALSMRRLGRELQVTPMAIYNHVRGRRDLLDGVADLVAQSIERPPPRWGWRRRTTAVLGGVREVCLAHPAAVPLLQDARALTPALLAPTETVLQALSDGGLTEAQARTGWAALIGLTFGHVGYQLAGHMGGPPTGVGMLDTRTFPRIASMAIAPPFDWDRAFAWALDALIRGLVAGRART